MATAVVEVNQARSDSSKPTRSHSRPQTIDSSPLDNVNPPDTPKKNEAATNCNHFSIRGYVAELRKRDPKLCDPFSLYRVHEGSLESEHELPPMVVPNFRWWKCGGCVPESNTPTPTGKQAHIEAQREQNAEVASSSSDSENNRNCSPSAIIAVDRKGKGKAYAEDEIIVHQTGCKNSMPKGIETGTSRDCIGRENGKVSSVSLPDLNEGNKAHSNEVDQNEVLVFGNGTVCDEEEDYYLGLDRRKAPKVRLLSELLGLKEIQNDAKLKKVRSAYSEVSESETESEDESTEIISEALVKKRGKPTSDEKRLPEKRKNKKIKTDHGAYSLTSSIKITPKSSSEKGKSLEENHVFTDASRVKPSQEVHSDQVKDLPRKSVISADLNEKRSGLAKGKGKMVPACKEQTSLKESTAFTKDEEGLQKGTQRNWNELSKDSSHSHRFSTNFVSAGNDQVHVTSAENGLYLPPSSTNPLILDYNAMRKRSINSCFKENSLDFRTSGGAPLTESQFDGTKERSNGVTTNSQVSSSAMNQKELTRRIQDIDINSIPTDDKAPDQGKGDDSHDIPMDIVELMAKNQYERNLGDPRDKYHHSISLSESVRSNGSTSILGEHMLNLKRSHFLSSQNPSHKDDRNNVISRFAASDSSKQKLLSCFSEFNQTHLTFGGNISKNQVSSNPLTFSQQGQKPYSTLNPTANAWTGGYMEAKQRTTPGFLHTMGSHNACHTASPRPNTEAHVWPSLVGGSSGKSHHQGPSILSFGTVDLEKQINFSNTYNGGNKPKAASSVDLYSNEVIPAMHLLSLMQNAGKSEPQKRGPSLFDHLQQQYKLNPGNKQSRHSKNNGRTSTVQESSIHPCYSTLPAVRSFASSFQNDGGSGSKTGFLAPIPLTSLGQRNINDSHFASFTPQRPVSNNIVARKRPLDSALNKGKGISHMSNPPFSSNSFQGTNSGNYSCGLATKRDNKTLCHSRQKEICVLNQNPSEFNDLKELRKYMIKPEDLRPLETRREKSVQRGNAKRQEMRMKKPITSCLVRKITI